MGYRAFLPENQTLQEAGHALRANAHSLHVHAINRQRIHLDPMNVNAL
jgi:hypothetical protein